MVSQGQEQGLGDVQPGMAIQRPPGREMLMTGGTAGRPAPGEAPEGRMRE